MPIQITSQFFDRIYIMISSNVYIKKISKRGKINIWLVDGAEVRKHDNEFTNFGEHYGFSFIPEFEFWLDKETVPNERTFFIDHLLVEWDLCRKGVEFDKALEMGDAKEEVERVKAGDLKKVYDKKGNVQLKHLHKKNMGNTNNSVYVWVIDGRLVRSGLFIDFVHGGHGYVYEFVPIEEVWLDDDLVYEELPFVLIHELHERNLMKDKNWNYAKAHESASKLEWKLRHNRKGVIKELQKLECSRELVGQLLNL